MSSTRSLPSQLDVPGGEGVPASALLVQAQALRQMAWDLERIARQGLVTGVMRDSRPVRWPDLFLVDWASTVQTAREVIAGLAPDNDQGSPSSAHAVLAVAAALQGDLEAARHEAVCAESHAGSPGETGVGPDIARALVWLAAGSPDVAFDALCAVVSAELRGKTEVESLAVCGYLAEAGARAGRRIEATDVIDRMVASRSGHLEAQELDEIAIARALLVAGQGFEAAIQEQLAHVRAGQQLRRGRLELALGMWLRRARRSSEARPHLEIASGVFEALGHRPWAETARRERRASGDGTRVPSSLCPLSPQERQIAELAAEGLSNRAIGSRLYLSPRTVGSHLYRIFPKLDITSRAQLARRLDELQTCEEE